MAEWTKGSAKWRFRMALANEFVTAAVIQMSAGRWIISVNGVRRTTAAYGSAEEAQKAAEGYIRKKLKQALAELGEPS